MKKAIFLDRDGTIIEEVNFLSNADEAVLFPFTIEALRLLSEAGFILFVTTNQSGVARGFFGASAIASIHEKIQNELDAAGVRIESFYYCPHFPDDGCRCRKPNTGMIEKAIKGFDIDLSESWTIGDKKLDIGLGFNAGTRTALVTTGYGNAHSNSLTRQPDIIAENLLAAANLIVGGK